ncbi:MAG: recombinase family protein [Ruminococcus sp.]|nr:recombinase family protein [Ruminococcus sp.]
MAVNDNADRINGDKPESEWLRVGNTHEGIVSKEDFETVQKMISAGRRQRSDSTTQIFAGLFICTYFQIGPKILTGTKKPRKAALYTHSTRG